MGLETRGRRAGTGVAVRNRAPIAALPASTPDERGGGQQGNPAPRREPAAWRAATTRGIATRLWIAGRRGRLIARDLGAVPVPQAQFELVVGHRIVPLPSAGSMADVKSLEGVVEARLDSAGRDVQPARDVLHRQVAVVAKSDNDPVLGRQRRDRVRKEIAVMRLGEGSTGRDRDLSRDVRGVPTTGSQTIATGVDEDPVEPRLEARRVPQRRPLPPGLLERVVRGVLCVGRVAQDRAGKAVGRVEMFIREAQEGLGAFGRLVDHGWPAVCHLDDLG